MDGRVQSAEPIEGNPLLALAAQDAVMQYVYQPYTLDGRPQEVQTTVTVPFHPDTAASASELPAMGFPAIGLRTGPAFLSRQAAEYTEEARQAKLEGAVTLTLTFGADGKTHDVRVVKSLGLGLDEKAVEAARKWTFRPAYQDGNPVDYPTTVTMSFHLVPAAPGALEIARKSKSGPQDAHQVILTPDPTVMAATKSYFIVSPSPGVTLPLLVSKTDPEYSELARNAKYQGTLTMSVSIGADGAMHGVRVLKSLGLGLDEKGIEAVKQWKFQPAYQDGKPIPYTATIQVEFRLI
jgi:TonB family protein